jgi:hypothetical protein
MGLLSKAGARNRGQINEVLVHYQRDHVVFNGIIFEAPQNRGPSGYIDPVSAITASFAVTLSLPMFRCLMLFPSSVDKELVAHRISKTLKREALCIFESKSTGRALEYLRPYL